MVRVVLLGQGMVGTHFAVGLERLKEGEIEPYGVPLADLDLGYTFDDIKIVASVDVDARKVGKSVYEVARELYGFEKVPSALKEVEVRAGLELGRMRDMEVPVRALDRERDLPEAIEEFYEYFLELKPDVVVDVCTTQRGPVIRDLRELERAVEEQRIRELAPSHLYAYLALRYAAEVAPVAYVNLIPIPIANSPAFVERAAELDSLVLGDDGATGATPLTADILEHLRERNRYVKSIAQFNIGGNTDFLALLDEERNRAKEFTKSSVVKDILGYEAPHFIRPTGYLEPLGDKKFVAMHVEYVSFNGAVDEIVVNMRINDSPALAGYIVDLTRLAKLALEAGISGTIYEVNAFYTKKPGPPGSPNISRIAAYYKLLEFIEKELGPKVGRKLGRVEVEVAE